MKRSRYLYTGMPLSLLWLFTAIQPIQAQFVPFSQYQFTPVLTNPALSSATDYTQVTLQTRTNYSQYVQPALSILHPLHTAGGRRYGAISAAAVRQSLGPADAYVMTGLAAGASYRVLLSSRHHVAMGLQAAWIRKTIGEEYADAATFFAISRFDPTIVYGEAITKTNANRISLSAGAVWTWTDTDDRQKALLGLAVFDLNEPSYHLQESDPRSRRQYIVSGSWRAWERFRIIVTPMIRYQQAYESVFRTKRTLSDVMHLGAETAYATGRELQNELGGTLLYTTYQSIILGIHYKLPAWTFAMSYDLRIDTGYGDYTRQTIEFMVGWRRKSVKLGS